MEDKVKQVLDLAPREQFDEMRRLYCSGKLRTVIKVAKVLKERHTPIEGTWERAKNLLDAMDEPDIRIDISNKDYLCLDQEPILGYPCQYVWHKTKNGQKSWLVVFNGEKNCCHLKKYSLVSDKEAEDIFNG